MCLIAYFFTSIFYLKVNCSGVKYKYNFLCQKYLEKLKNLKVARFNILFSNMEVKKSSNILLLGVIL